MAQHRGWTWLLSLALLPVVGAFAAAQGEEESATAVLSSLDDPVDLCGLLDVGYRFVDVAGNEAQYEEDLDLGAGILLRNLEFSATTRSDAARLHALRARATGMGDPSTSYRLGIEGDGWSADARYDRTRFQANTDSEIHRIDVSRETATLAFSTGDENRGLRNGLELSYLNRDGVSIGSRSARFEFVEGFPVRRRDKTVGARLTGGTTGTSALQVAWVVGLEARDASDRQVLDEPLPSDPAEVFTEDFSSDTSGHDLFGTLTLGTDFAGGRVSFEAGASSEDTSGSFLLDESGFFDPTLPFLRTTDGVLDASGHSWRALLGYARPLGDTTDLAVRLLHEASTEHNRVRRTIALDELFGDPPSVSTFRDSSLESSDLDQLEVDLTEQLSDALELDVQASYGRDDVKIEDVVELLPIHFFDGTVDRWRAEARLRWDDGRPLSGELAAGRQVVPTDTTLIASAFTLEDQRETFVEARGRWRPDEKTSLAASARYEHRRSDGFDARGTTSRYAVSGSTELAEGWRADASFTYRNVDLASDTNFLVFDPITGVSVVPATVRFGSNQRIWTAGLTGDLSPDVHPRLDTSLVTATGDSAFDTTLLRAELPWAVSDALELGLDAMHLEFRGEGLLASSEYDADLLFLFLRVRF